MSNRHAYRVWDGKMMHHVDTLSFPVGGIKWYGPGVGDGWVEVNPEAWDGPIPERIDTLLQSTGLRDKHGKLIFEGDTCKAHGWDNSPHTVVFADGGFATKVDGIDMCNDINIFYPSSGPQLEVIGNIHENPLQKEQNDNR